MGPRGLGDVPPGLKTLEGGWVQATSQLEIVSKKEQTIKLEDFIRETFLLGSDIEVLDSLGPGQLDGWDSLGHANLMVAMESAYEISIDLEEALLIETIADIKRMLDEKGVAYE